MLQHKLTYNKHYKFAFMHEQAILFINAVHLMHYYYAPASR